MKKQTKETLIRAGCLSSIVLGFALGMYLFTSYQFGTLNYKKWEGIRKERFNQVYHEEIAKNYFKHFDIDKDKKISIDEFFEKYPKKLYKNHVPFNDYDLNKDKIIDSTEFIKVFHGDDCFY